MAKKKSLPKQKASSVEEKINKNSLYMKVCESSASCDAEKKLTDLGNMTAKICTQCLHIFEWEIKTVEKPEKAVKPKADTKKAKEEIEEAQVINESKEDIIEKNAEEMRKSFAEIDAMGIDNVSVPVPTSPKENTKKSSVKEFEDDDFDMEFSETKVTEDVFSIVNISIVSQTEVGLICETHNQKARFKVITTTSPEKVKIIQASPEKVIGKKAKVSFKGLDEKLRPIEPLYISFSK